MCLELLAITTPQTQCYIVLKIPLSIKVIQGPTRIAYYTLLESLTTFLIQTSRISHTPP